MANRLTGDKSMTTDSLENGRLPLFRNFDEHGNPIGRPRTLLIDSEQVIGRALRRQSYDLNEEELFNVEYADILGIPFDFTAKPVVAPPQKPRETIQVKAVRPERDHLEIRFPRVAGYRVELPEERLTAEFNVENKSLGDRLAPLSYQWKSILRRRSKPSLIKWLKGSFFNPSRKYVIP